MKKLVQTEIDKAIGNPPKEMTSEEVYRQALERVQVLSLRFMSDPIDSWMETAMRIRHLVREALGNG